MIGLCASKTEKTNVSCTYQLEIRKARKQGWFYATAALFSWKYSPHHLVYFLHRNIAAFYRTFKVNKGRYSLFVKASYLGKKDQLVQDIKAITPRYMYMYISKWA